MYELSENCHAIVRQSVLITGSARSGTSIFGKLFGTLERVEYFFEPPLLFSLFAILDKLPCSQSRLIFDTYLYEELLIGALSGRSINLRHQDDSSIYNSKTSGEIDRRLGGTGRKRDINVGNAQIAVKVPDFVYQLTKILEKTNLNQLFISIRDPGATIHSLIKRGWFTNAALQTGDITWPNRFDKIIPTPHWVPEDWLDAWEKMFDADRAALYYITQTDISNQLPTSTLIFDYEQLLMQPRALLELVAGHMGLSFGPHTNKILSQVKLQESTAHFDLNRIRGDLRAKVKDVYSESMLRCITI
jgi:hypothetical protein